MIFSSTSPLAVMCRRIVVVFRRRVNRGFLVANLSGWRWTPLSTFDDGDEDEEDPFIVPEILFQAVVSIHHSNTWQCRMGWTEGLSELFILQT
jgi:hypothetical protein